jgi:hypothetical protein
MLLFVRCDGKGSSRKADRLIGPGARGLCVGNVGGADRCSFNAICVGVNGTDSNRPV